MLKALLFTAVALIIAVGVYAIYRNTKTLEKL